jgi:cytochrome P450
MTRDDVISNAILVNGASWGAVSNTLSFLMYELAKNPATQEMIVHEIVTVMKRQGDDTHLNDLLPDFVYLEAALNETLRLHPVETRIYRRVSAKQGAYLPGTDIMLPYGTSIQVSLYALSHDPDLWPNPESFDPDRFLPQNKAYHRNCSFMAFSAGGRHCPGYKLSHNQMKRTMIDILREFEVTTYAPEQHVFPQNSFINIPLIQVGVKVRDTPLFHV